MTHFLSVCLLSLFLVCASAVNVSAQDFSQYERHLYVTAAGDTLPYRLLKPLNYKEGKKYPLVVLFPENAATTTKHSSSTEHTFSCKRQTVKIIPVSCWCRSAQKRPVGLVSP